MYCDPITSDYSCPDVYCGAKNFTFTVCKYNATLASDKKTVVKSYTSCPSTNSIACTSFSGCDQLVPYIALKGVNSSNVADNTFNAARCVSGSAPHEDLTALRGSTNSTSPAASTSDANPLFLNSILLFICILSLSIMNKRF